MTMVPNIVLGSALLFFYASALADNSSIQGTVIGADGKPLAAAEVQAQRLDAKTAPVLTRTDSKGRYVLKGLPPGGYAVTAIVKNEAKAHTNVKTRNGALAQVDFDLRAPATARNVAARPAATPANPLGAEDLNRMQRSMGGNINNMSFPGH